MALFWSHFSELPYLTPQIHALSNGFYYLYILLLRSTQYCHFFISKRYKMDELQPYTQVQTFNFVSESSFCKWIKLTEKINAQKHRANCEFKKQKKTTWSEITCVSWSHWKDVQRIRAAKREKRSINTKLIRKCRASGKKVKKRSACLYSFYLLSVSSIVPLCVCGRVMFTVNSLFDGSFFSIVFPSITIYINGINFIMSLPWLS